MISGEHVIEPSQMVKNDYRGNKVGNTASSNQGKRRISQNRESSGVKKTNIEVLDPDAPMEYYKNNYNEGKDVPPHELEAQSLNYQKQYVSGGGLPDAL